MIGRSYPLKFGTSPRSIIAADDFNLSQLNKSGCQDLKMGRQDLNIGGGGARLSKRLI